MTNNDPIKGAAAGEADASLQPDRNPLLGAWAQHDGVPPFDRVQSEHFEPAYQAAMREHRAEIDAIAHQAEAPTFDNTIARHDASGIALERTDLLFGNLVASLGTPELLAIEQRLAPVLAAHHNAIHLDAALFGRIDALHAQRDRLSLDAESSGCWSGCTNPSSCLALTCRAQPESAMRRSRSVSQSSVHASIRTCWPTRLTGI